MDDVISLIVQTVTQDENGVEHRAKTERVVFCKVGSITRNEYFGAGRSGLNPSKVFTVFRGDYAGESIIAHNGLMYAVYRTYLPEGSDYIELYVKREGGTNGESDA